ncbi:MAG: hypothetical protein K9J37_09880 [Saprospiraceae bacterium]|nr:hypothetical protein [Saprospiraceae bacterium]MCF8250212.1 hypothetical protein [Saprospiraceae bacterium]MCF8280025.1 hypothetical protein [Bacteroidales bacterium]MCF8312020.1 hypothetical protein [Saprospiraceae bacterium]MCF8441117.1 hypothetical protein [Saprospiraceae bacterium]
MQYPDRLIPRINFKRIETDLSAYVLCRVVNSPRLLEKVNGIYPEETLCENDKDLFDYSTNLLGHFLPEDNQIELIGENKKYFYSYWDFEEEVGLPVYQQDFEIATERSFFTLPIVEIHQKLSVPLLDHPKRYSETITSNVVHTPTRSNFWHFSICWKGADGYEKYKKDSAWQKRIYATMRHYLQDCICTNTPEKLEPISIIHYSKG